MPEKEKICPSCSNAVPEIAYKCRFCGYYFEPENISPTENRIKYFISKLPSIMLGLLIALAVLSLGFLILNPFLKTSSNKPARSVKNTQTPWFVGGNLHKATVKQWRNATYTNRLATSADFVASTQKVDFGDMDKFKTMATETEECISTAVSGENVDNQKVSDIAVGCLILLFP
jgi:hypothetical protein